MHTYSTLRGHYRAASFPSTGIRNAVPCASNTTLTTYAQTCAEAYRRRDGGAARRPPPRCRERPVGRARRVAPSALAAPGAARLDRLRSRRREAPTASGSSSPSAARRGANSTFTLARRAKPPRVLLRLRRPRPATLDGAATLVPSSRPMSSARRALAAARCASSSSGVRAGFTGATGTPCCPVKPPARASGFSVSPMSSPWRALAAPARARARRVPPRTERATEAPLPPRAAAGCTEHVTRHADAGEWCCVKAAAGVQLMR